MPVFDFIGVYKKRPSAREPIAIDFRDRIPAESTPDGHQVTVDDENGAVVTGTIVAASELRGSRVIVLLQNGNDGTDYFVHFALTAGVYRLEDSIKMEARN